MGWIAGALTETDYRGKLGAAGFTSVDVEATRVYGVEDAATFLAGQGLDVETAAKEVEGKIVSAFSRAVKPEATRCCSPSWCQ